MKLPGNETRTDFRTFLSFAMSFILLWGLIPAIAIADAIRSLYTREQDSGYVVAHSIEDSNELAKNLSETVLASLPVDASNVDRASAAFHAIADKVVISDEAPSDSYEALVAALHGEATTAEGATQAFVLVVQQMGFESEVFYEGDEVFAKVVLDDVTQHINVAGSIIARMETGAAVADEIWLAEDAAPALETVEEQNANANAIEVQDEIATQDVVPQDGEEELLTTQASNISVPAQTSNVNEYLPYTSDSPRTSYLYTNASGELERVEFTQNTLVVETLNSSFGVKKQTIIPSSSYVPSDLVRGNLVWGGFFSGEQYNYVATGQRNDDYDDDLVVYRITRFPKNWDTSRIMKAEFTDGYHRVPSDMRASITSDSFKYGTLSPFEQGTCVMEEQGGMLHLRTSHIMYNGHQGTAHLVINESNMTITDSMTYVMNRYDTTYGYATHSFAQRLAKLNGTMYGLDLGDAAPRSIAIKKLGVKNNTGDILQIRGASSTEWANNFTGVTLGGFASSTSANALVVTGATIEQAAHDGAAYASKRPGNFTPRNAFVAIVNPGNTIAKAATFNTLTNYAYDGDRGADLTKLVKIDDNRFLVLWAEMKCGGNAAKWDESNQTGKLGYVFVDAKGNTLGSVKSKDGLLSGCDPVLYGGKVVWFAQDIRGDGTSPVYYTIDAYEGAQSGDSGTTPSSDENKDTVVSIANATVASIADQTYTGKAITPAITVTYKGTTLKQNIDYRVTYQDNTNVTNAAKVNIEGVSKYNGTKSSTFKIVAASISSVVPSTTSYTYDGTEKKPGVTVKAGNLVVPSSGYTAVYKNNKAVGTATVTVTGKGNYTGTKSAEFKINAASSSSSGTSSSTSTISFNDVTASTPHREDILWMADSGISTGWKNADGTRSFRPSANVARGDMAAFLFRLAKKWGLVDDNWKATNTKAFVDVTDNTAHCKEIWWMAEAGISAGWKVGAGKEFRPANTVARGDMAAFLYRLAKLRKIAPESFTPADSRVFIDVTSTTPHCNDIWWLAENGISAGWKTASGKKEFRPFNTVNRADFAAFLHRLDKLAS